MNVRYIFFDKFHVAGASYFSDFDRLIDEIPIGAEVCFRREPKNRHDKNALAVYYKGYKLGYVPQVQNEKYVRLIDRGLTELLYATVASIDKETRYKEAMLEISVSLRLDGTSFYSLTARESRMIEDAKNLDLSGMLRAFSGLDKYGELQMPTLGALLNIRNVDVAFTTIMEQDLLKRMYFAPEIEGKVKEEEPEAPKEKGVDYDDPDTFIGEYFPPMKMHDEYPLICVYLNRIENISAGDAESRCFTICETFIHECMHALFDHEPRKKGHPYDSFLEEPTCECGAIMIAQELDKMYPGFGDFVLKSVDSKVTKYGLGADLYRYWSSCEEQGDNAVDAYNDACDKIVFKKDGRAVSGWTGRMPYTQAIPEMKAIYSAAHRKRMSNQTEKPR